MVQDTPYSRGSRTPGADLIGSNMGTSRRAGLLPSANVVLATVDLPSDIVSAVGWLFVKKGVDFHKIQQHQS